MLTEDEKYELPPAFLMEMMELNELAEEDKAQFENAAITLQNELEEAIAPILNKFNSETTYEADLQKLKEYYFKKKYLNRILDKLAD